jgi:long-subunit fatty acid transport protein
MKKLLLIITGALLLPTLVNAGGIVTNTNQSAYWVRTMVRDASTGIDAAYFNPAGLVKLSDGFHFSLSNQTIFQNKDVTAEYQLLSPNPKEFKGDIKVPFFPSLYGAWKKGKFAVSLGFNPIGGGGGAEYKEGLASIEMPLGLLVPTISQSLTPLDNGILLATGTDPMLRNVTGYQADIYFKGTSVFFGYQLNLSYKISDMISVAAGARYVTAKNTYKGHIKDIMITAAPLNPALGGTLTPGDYLRNIGNTFGRADLVAAGSMLDAQTVDREVDAEEKGTGFAPILGAHLSLADNKLDIGIKYEFKTKLELKTTVNDGKDGYGMFKQDSAVNSDIPAMLSVGVGYKILDNFNVMAGFHYYWDKSANYGKTLDAEPNVPVKNDKVIDKNYFEIGLGLEYGVTENFFISGGYLLAKTGVSEDYQSDMSYSLSSNTFGLGFGIKFNENIMLNLGGSYSIYNKGTKEGTDGTSSLPYKFELTKNTLIIALGLDISF